MKLEYTGINFDDLRGSLLADYLIGVHADLTIMDAGRVIYEEPSFPVVELARSLVDWINSGGLGVFEFTSLTAEESGIVTIAPEMGGWYMFSSWTPEVRSDKTPWLALKKCLLEFVDTVRGDLVKRGVDADFVLQL